MALIDASILNTLFQKEFGTEISLGEVFDWLSRRPDAQLIDSIEEVELVEWAENWAGNEGKVSLEDVAIEDLLGELMSREDWQEDVKKHMAWRANAIPSELFDQDEIDSCCSFVEEHNQLGADEEG